MRQNCFIVPASHPGRFVRQDGYGCIVPESHFLPEKFSPLTLAPYRLGLCAEAVAAECATAADIESKLEELEDMYQVRQNRPRQMLWVFVAAFD